MAGSYEPTAFNVDDPNLKKEIKDLKEDSEYLNRIFSLQIVSNDGSDLSLLWNLMSQGSPDESVITSQTVEHARKVGMNFVLTANILKGMTQRKGKDLFAAP